MDTIVCYVQADAMLCNVLCCAMCYAVPPMCCAVLCYNQANATYTTAGVCTNLVVLSVYEFKREGDDKERRKIVAGKYGNGMGRRGLYRRHECCVGFDPRRKGREGQRVA